MKSHLTRRVFQSIIANEPIVHRGCLQIRAYGTRGPVRPGTSARSQHSDTLAPCPPHRRTFFNLGVFGTKQRDVKEADIDPGQDVMQDLERMKRMRARLPLPEDVADAVTSFFEAKARRKQGLTDTQARLAHESMNYCLQSHDGSEAHSKMLDPSLLNHVAASASRPKQQKPTANHVDLLRFLVELVLKYEIKALDISGNTALAYVQVLISTGKTSEARAFVREFAMCNDDTVEQDARTPGRDDTLPSRTLLKLWRKVMFGFAIEGNREDLLETLRELEAQTPNAKGIAARTMLHFYLQENDAQAVEHWFWIFWHDSRGNPEQIGRLFLIQQTAEWISRVLSWCIEHEELALGHKIVRQLLADNPPKKYWDLILVWAAGTGKGADEINRMLSVMEASNETTASPDKQAHPDIATINGLVEFAITKNDPYLAERFIAIGKQRNIQPDARTYVLQMQYRLKVKDVDGALVAYTNLQSMDISDNEDVLTVNELIVALCNSKRHDFDTIMNVAADLSDRRTRFEPSTVSSLALLHLNRDEVHDVVDLLNTHGNHYSSLERRLIQDTIFGFCMDPKTPTSRAWDAYTILRSVFDEMSRDQRTDLMANFFSRNRSDMATHIFSSMRNHSRPDVLPTIDTYVAAFLACAKLRDIDVLEVIHNQLKLDYNIDPTTHLYNALIIGYTAAGKPRRALEFWDDIVASKEGPTYDSIHIALRACEKAALGDAKAQEIWRRLRRTNIELDPSLWASYAGALVGNGDLNLALRTIEDAESQGEVEIDAYLIGTLFSACPGQTKQNEVERWTKEKHPHIWTELEKIGIATDEIGMRTVKLDRAVTP